jgi:hypothetical protein
MYVAASQRLVPAEERLEREQREMAAIAAEAEAKEKQTKMENVRVCCVRERCTCFVCVFVCAM